MDDSGHLEDDQESESQSEKSLGDGKAIQPKMIPPFKKESFALSTTLKLEHTVNTCTRRIKRQPGDWDLRTEYLIRHPADLVPVPPTVSRSIVEDKLKVWFTSKVHTGKTSGTQVFTFK